MQDGNRGTRNLMEIIEEHMKEDVVIRSRVYESHNSDGFKKMNREFKKTVHRYWSDDRDLGYLCGKDMATLREMYYDFEL